MKAARPSRENLIEQVEQTLRRNPLAKQSLPECRYDWRNLEPVVHYG